MNNHTCTHVLNFALRKVVGEVDQRGSLVAADRLRFDFTSKGALKVDEVKRVETICEEVVNSKLNVYAKETPLAGKLAIIRKSKINSKTRSFKRNKLRLTDC